MKNLTNLFKILELTRSQPQYGYVPAGVLQDELSNLAEHQYLVTMFAWQLASQLKKKGAKIDVLKVLEICLIHDIGELFGGDIAMLYANVNPKAREHAKAFEAENIKFLGKFFGDGKEDFLALTSEIINPKSDEALVAKVADYLEHPHFMKYIKVFPKKSTFKSTEKKLQLLISRIHDFVLRKELSKFVKSWAKDIYQKEALDVLFGDVK